MQLARSIVFRAGTERAATGSTAVGSSASARAPGAARSDEASSPPARRLVAGSAPVPSVVALFLVALLVPAGLAAQPSCPAAAGPDAEAGWSAYRAGELDEARARFEAARTLCPDHLAARTGLGYVEMRDGNDPRARRLFQAVLADNPGSVDALVGLGLLAWRAGDLEAVSEHFLAVRELDPDHPTAADYLARLPEGLGPPPARPPLVLPDTLELVARARGERIEIRTDDGWRPFYLKGMNLGTALPGRHPSQFPDSATYARWIADMAAMGVNSVRLYTIHPPHFYEALATYNRAHPDAPLRLVHGVWTELPDDHDYLGADFEAHFFGEMRRVVDLVHGRADLPPRPGHASGFYTADVSEWTVAYIIGREWEPYSVLAFDSIHPELEGWEGRYLTVEGGNAMEAWLGKAVERMVAYETETYREQRPVAYTNWPTLDPLHHPTETTRDQEVAIREARGETVDLPPREYDNDRVGLDATRVRPTDAFPAGTFASFHAYPYYPDFMVLQPSYGEARSSLGPSRYFGYLGELVEHHRGMPVVIAEYGVPASLGTGHFQPQGWHHGGLTEGEMAEVDRRLTLELAEAGAAGGMLFAWVDEWFKKNWVVIDFEIPLDRNRLWYNRLDAEQHYGMWAMEAEPPFAGATLDERLAAWREVQPLSEAEGTGGEASARAGVRGQAASGVEPTPGGAVRAAWDEAYLWLLVEAPNRRVGDVLLVGFDMIDPAAGDVRWPGGEGPEIGAGVEFVLRDDGETVRVVADPSQNPWRMQPVGQGASRLEGATVEIDDPLPGFFRGRVEQRFNLPYYSEPNADGRYDSLKVVVNRRRFARDSTEYLAMGYDRGLLPGGPAPDGFWERAEGGRVLEVRIPWMLLNVTDPSGRRVLQGPGANVEGAEPDEVTGRWTLTSGVRHWPDSLTGGLGTETVEDIGIAAALADAEGGWTSWPVARFSWPTWDEPRWRERRRPAWEALRSTFEAMDPYGATRVAAEVVPDLDPVPVSPERTVPPSFSGRPDSLAGAPEATGDTLADVPSAEAADSAWRSGDTDRARRLYARRLAADSTDGVALHRTALMRAWNEEYDEAIALLDHLLEQQPGNLDARIDRARITAWKGELDDALTSLDELLAEYPDHPRALEARARFQAWAGQYEASLSTYDELLGIAPGDAAVRRSRAEILSWAEEFSESRAAYDSLIRADPDDLEARLGLARVLTFADRLTAARREYREVLDRDADNVRAWQGLGRVLSWDGELVDGEAAYRTAVAIAPDDVTTLVGLGQNLRWQGRNAAALEVLRRAEALSPSNRDVQEQLGWVRVALGPRLRPSVVVENDSDDNTMVTTSVTAEYHPRPRLGVRVDAYERALEQRLLERDARGVTVSADYQLEPGWSVSVGVGASENDGSGEETIGTVRAGVSSPGRYPVVGGLTFARTALDATARLAATGVAMNALDATVRWTAAPGWTVNGALGRATLEGSEDNTRLHGSASVVRRVTRTWSLGAAVRSFGYDRNLNDGYFDPDFYGIAELTGRVEFEPRDWQLRLEVAPGTQQVTSDGELAGTFRTSGRVAYRFGPGREVSLSGGFSSTGLQSFSTGDSDYRYTAVILSASWVF